MREQLWKPLVMLFLFRLSMSTIRVSADPQVPCLFAFGDSLSDNGNNNNLPTLAKANYLPYGIDFPNSVPTGRFTNGLNSVDFIAKLLGFLNFIPPFANATGPDILQGVNYASSGAGIRDDTGSIFGIVVPLKKQIDNHKTTILQMRDLLGSRNSTEALLNKCIYNVNIGSNDYLVNYFYPLSLTNVLFTPQQYALDLIQQLQTQLQILYEVGARKFVVYGVGLIGCTPYARANFNANASGCVDRFNNITNLFNVRLKTLVIQLNANFTDAKFTFINSSALLPTGGQLITDTPCCQLSPTGIQCEPGSTPCPNRYQYVFYDGVHPTNVTYSAAALQAYQSTSPDVAYPYSISQLVSLL